MPAEVLKIIESFFLAALSSVSSFASWFALSVTRSYALRTDRHARRYDFLSKRGHHRGANFGSILCFEESDAFLPPAAIPMIVSGKRRRKRSHRRRSFSAMLDRRLYIIEEAEEEKEEVVEAFSDTDSSSYSESVDSLSDESIGEWSALVGYGSVPSPSLSDCSTVDSPTIATPTPLPNPEAYEYFPVATYEKIPTADILFADSSDGLGFTDLVDINTQKAPCQVFATADCLFKDEPAPPVPFQLYTDKLSYRQVSVS